MTQPSCYAKSQLVAGGGIGKLQTFISPTTLSLIPVGKLDRVLTSHVWLGKQPLRGKETGGIEVRVERGGWRERPGQNP